jgi:hypothetical protein
MCASLYVCVRVRVRVFVTSCSFSFLLHDNTRMYSPLAQGKDVRPSSLGVTPVAVRQAWVVYHALAAMHGRRRPCTRHRPATGPPRPATDPPQRPATGPPQRPATGPPQRPATGPRRPAIGQAGPGDARAWCPGCGATVAQGCGVVIVRLARGVRRSLGLSHNQKPPFSLGVIALPETPFQFGGYCITRNPLSIWGLFHNQKPPFSLGVIA